MGLFDRLRRKKESAEAPAGKAAEQSAPLDRPAPPEEDTMALLFFGKCVGAEAAAAAVRGTFGQNAVRSIDNSHPRVPALLLDLEGVEFWCSCMPMPHPAEVCDFSAVQGGLCSQEEREEILAHQSFMVLAQKGGGKSLADKRTICRLFTRLIAALMGLEGAAGAYLHSAELLISQRLYLKHAEILKEHLQDPAYFPAPLWISIRQGKKGEHSMMGTWGLRQFGFQELWFLNSPADWAELSERLFLLSIFQITERDFYRNLDTIQFTPGKTSVFKELNGALFLVEERG